MEEINNKITARSARKRDIPSRQVSLAERESEKYNQEKSQKETTTAHRKREKEIKRVVRKEWKTKGTNIACLLSTEKKKKVYTQSRCRNYRVFSRAVPIYSTKRDNNFCPALSSIFSPSVNCALFHLFSAVAGRADNNNNNNNKSKK